MKLLVWNICHGGGQRIPRIVEEVAAHDPDVIALTEYRSKPGVALSAEFVDRGWRYMETTNPAENENGIAVFSRTRVWRTRPCPAPPDNQARWIEFDLPEPGFGIAVLHIMAASGRTDPTGAAKARFWDAVLDAAKYRLGQPYLFVGDWNTGAHRVDEKGKTFVCSEHFGRLSELGWIDLWRHHNSGATEYTWYSRRSGARCNGFRLDHAFASPVILPRVASCRYLHLARDAGISDHSIVLVSIDDSPL